MSDKEQCSSCNIYENKAYPSSELIYCQSCEKPFCIKCYLEFSHDEHDTEGINQKYLGNYNYIN